VYGFFKQFCWPFFTEGSALFEKINLATLPQPKNSVKSAYHYDAKACMHMLTVASECWHLQNQLPLQNFSVEE